MFISQHYETRMPTGIPIMWLMMVVFFLGKELGEVIQMNTIYTYTYSEPQSCPGTLRSERLTPIWWTELLAGRLRTIFICTTLVRLCIYENPWAVNFHMISSIFYIVSEAANVIELGLEIEDCNIKEGNRCNDYRWCGPNGGNSTFCPKNYCAIPFASNCSALGNVTPWSPVVVQDDLKWKTEFTISFGLSLVMLAIGIIVSIMSYLSRNPVESVVDAVKVGGKQGQPTPTPNVNNTNASYSNTPTKNDYSELRLSDSLGW